MIRPTRNALLRKKRSSTTIIASCFNVSQLFFELVDFPSHIWVVGTLNTNGAKCFCFRPPLGVPLPHHHATKKRKKNYRHKENEKHLLSLSTCRRKNKCFVFDLALLVPQVIDILGGSS